MTKQNSAQNQINDPGFGEKVGGASRRIINKDGSFNIQRVGGEGGFRNLYQHLMQLSNGMFFLVVLGGFILINVVFAILYYLVGPEHLIGVRGENAIEHFLDCFYFSAQTFTTVGYGAIAPRGVMASTLASLEALLGLLSLAIATGLLYTRFSRPKARLRFSQNAVVTPFEEGNALMFRFVNARNNVLMNLTARVILTMHETADTSSDRKYYELELTIKEVMFLAMTWTLVHKITDTSKMKGLTSQDLIDRGAEILILISGYDDTFSQTVHTRYSYSADEIVWGAKFVKAFSTNEQGLVKLDLSNIDLITQATLKA